jgi:hypothetical protein
MAKAIDFIGDACLVTWAKQRHSDAGLPVEVPQANGIGLGVGVGPSLVLRPQSPSVPPRIVHPPRAFMLGGDAAES